MKEGEDEIDFSLWGLYRATKKVTRKVKRTVGRTGSAVFGRSLRKKQK